MCVVISILKNRLFLNLVPWMEKFIISEKNCKLPQIEEILWEVFFFLVGQLIRQIQCFMR